MVLKSLQSHFSRTLQFNKSGSFLLLAVLFSLGTFTTSAQSLTNYVIAFDGVDDKVKTDNSLSPGAGDFTLTARIFVNNPAAANCIAGNYNYPTDGNGIEFYVYQNKLVTYIQGYAFGSTIISANTWYHVAVTRRNGDIRMYVNGNVDGYGYLPATISYNSDFTVGGFPTNNQESFGGMIDEVMYYHRALNDAEVAQIATLPYPQVSSSNLVLQFKFDEGSGNLTYNSAIYKPNGTLVNGATFVNSTFGIIQHNIYAFAGANGSISPSGTSTVSNFGSITYTITPDAGYSILDVTVDSVSVGNVSSYTFDTVSTSHIIMTTFTANTPPPPPPPSSNENALHFDGVDDGIIIGNASIFQLNSGTVQAWIKTSAPGSSWRGIVVKQWAYSLFLKDNILISYDWTSGDISTGVKLADNTWHHVVLSFNNGVPNGSHLYIDGVVVHSFTYNIANHNEPLVIGMGGDYFYSQNFGGLIDDVRLWNRQLNAGEISDLYSNHSLANYNGLVAHYNFNQGIAGGNNSGLNYLMEPGGYFGNLSNFTLNGNTSNWVNGLDSSQISPPPPSGSPILALESDSMDFGNLALNFIVDDSIKITNTGNADLIINSVTVLDTQFTANLGKTTIVPGDSTYLYLSWRSGIAGLNNTRVTLNSNAGGNISLFLKGNAFSTGYTYNYRNTGFGGNFYGASYINRYAGCIAGTNGSVYSTSDGGVTWSSIFTGTNETIYNLRLIGSNAWIFGSNGLICVSSNGGPFTPFTTGTNATFYAGSFINAYYGFAVGSNGTICRYNGGSWTPNPTGVSNTFYGVYTIGNTAYAVGSGGIICRYNGTSWVPLSAGNGSSDFYGVSFYDENYGFVVGANGHICKTTDGGQTWVVLNSGVNVNIRSVKIYNKDICWVTCDDGTILQTTDGGLNWIKIPISNTGIRSIDFVGCQGIVVGDNGQVYTFETSFCDDTYNSYYTGKYCGTPFNLYGSSFSSASNGYVAGRSGTVLRTTNGGSSWISSNTGTIADFTCIKTVGSEVFIGGTNGTLCKSVNGGNSWIPFSTGFSGTFYSMAFYNNGDGWVVGSNGTICRYNGSGWIPYPTGVSNTFYSVYVIGNVAYAVGSGGIICKYNGSAWVPLNSGTIIDFYACAFVTEQIGYAVGAGGIICKTINGGLSWFPIASPTTDDLYAVEVGCLLEVMCAGANGASHQSSDGGSSWSNVNLNRNIKINTISLLNGQGFIAGENGEAYSFAFGSGPVTAGITANGPLSFCEGGNVTLTADSSASYLWSDGSVSQAITVNKSGTYILEAFDGSGCSAKDTVEVVVWPLPALAFNLTDSIYCINEGAQSLSATPSGGLFSGPGISGSNFNPFIAGLGVHQISYNYTTLNGCSKTISKNIEVKDAPLVNAGADVKVYFGYAPMASATLNATVTGGSAPYTYLWSNNANTSSTLVSPTVTTLYIVTVSDAFGCTSTDSVEVEVVDVRCGKNNDKVLVCHTISNKIHNICVAASAVPAHLAHGDYLGDCNNNQSLPAGINMASGLEVFPNPANGKVNIHFISDKEVNIEMTILDIRGSKVMDIFTGTIAKGLNQFEVNTERLSQALYIVQLRREGKTDAVILSIE